MMMHLSSILSALLVCSTYVLGAPPVKPANQSQYSPQFQKIIKNAKADGIDLLALPFAAAAFAGIEEAQRPVKINKTVTAERINVHGVWIQKLFGALRCSWTKHPFYLAHAIPTWYANLIPVPPGTATPLPPWSVQSHLAFMAANGKASDWYLKMRLLNSWV